MAKKKPRPSPTRPRKWVYREHNYNTWRKSAWKTIGYAEYIRAAQECNISRPDSISGFVASSKERKRITIEVRGK